LSSSSLAAAWMLSLYSFLMVSIKSGFSAGANVIPFDLVSSGSFGLMRISNLY